jgi:hypothetical protein
MDSSYKSLFLSKEGNAWELAALFDLRSFAKYIEFVTVSFF